MFRRKSGGICRTILSSFRRHFFGSFLWIDDMNRFRLSFQVPESWKVGKKVGFPKVFSAQKSNSSSFILLAFKKNVHKPIFEPNDALVNPSEVCLLIDDQSQPHLQKLPGLSPSCESKATPPMHHPAMCPQGRLFPGGNVAFGGGYSTRLDSHDS